MSNEQTPLVTALAALMITFAAYALKQELQAPITPPTVICESGEEDDSEEQYTVWINAHCENAETHQPVTVRLID